MRERGMREEEYESVRPWYGEYPAFAKYPVQGSLLQINFLDSKFCIKFH